ncbi:hypothetical protein CesoFtcFv8_002563 [Champsocephalus esox]|uniref:Uncharacterized protein n=1 Tax=Champsocephalus esox TaxID=159716 RepID=A0AAN8D3D5_9TELE|nr:hypothetical protein CesoFtcFv8_002563 [Champsocephalus esox]
MLRCLSSSSVWPCRDPAAWMKQCYSAHQRHQVIWQSGLFYSYVSPCVDLADQRSTGLEGCNNSDFFSLSIGMGGIVTLASYSNFDNNMFLDSFVVTLLNHATSVFAGFDIFSILGHIAHIYGKPVAAVVKEGFGLAFIVFPDTLAKLPIYPLWSILVFFMFIIVGLDSQFTCLEVLTTCLSDAFRENFKSKRTSLTIGTCVTVFLLGLPCVTRVHQIYRQ